MKNVLKVCAAVIVQGTRVLCCMKTSGEYQGMLEFPGGKVEPGETHEQALNREIKEELDSEIVVACELHNTIYNYDVCTVDITFYRCALVDKPRPMEGQRVIWMDTKMIDSNDFLPADREMVGLLQEAIQGRRVHGLVDVCNRQ